MVAGARNRGNLQISEGWLPRVSWLQLGVRRRRRRQADFEAAAWFRSIPIPEAAPPKQDKFVADADAALEQQVFDLPQ